MRSKLQPATGICRWLDGEGSVEPLTGNHFLRVTVNTSAGPVVRDYEVADLGGDGYALYYIDPKTFTLGVHHIRFVGPRDWRCDCDDARNRPERANCCKHVRALRAALAKLPL